MPPSFLPAAFCALTGRLALATTLALAGPAALAASAAHATEAPVATQLKIAAPASVVSGARTVVSIALSKAGTAVVGERVMIQAYVNGSWRSLTAVNTDSRGFGRWTGTLTRTLTFRAVKAATATYTRAVTANVTTRVTAPPNALGDRVLSIARAQIGDPYVYGATGPNSFDCSGLTGYAYAHAGRAIPRTSSQQYAATRHIPHSSARPGDLVFLFSGGRVSHVGVYSGNGRMVDSPKPGAYVKERAIYASYVVGRVG